MKAGPAIRRMFGPFERQVTDAYRSIYVDIDAFVRLVVAWCPTPPRILEVGCGEGAVTQRLLAAYSTSELTAIDVTSRVGRMYRGPLDRVRFMCRAVQDIAAEEPGSFDLIVLSDVLHHVPVESRQGLLEAVRLTLRPHGKLVFKDWERNFSPIHLLCFLSDRWLTGDRVNYMSRGEMRDRLASCFGATSIVAETRVGPWWNNLAMLIEVP